MERTRVIEHFSREDYTVGWICALAPELAAAAAMMDETYAPPAAFQQDPNDSNVYSYGRMGQHKVVIASLGAGMPGKVPASTTATNLLRSFPRIRFGLMVGIGGGIPAKIAEDSADDIRLGDVVVSVPHGESGGVVQYDHGKVVHEGHFVQTGSLGKPPTILLKAVQRVQAEHDMQGSSIPRLLGKILQDRPKMAVKYRRPDAEDRLYQAQYEHPADAKNCSRCDARHLVQRPARDSDEPVIHYGLIGSADRVMLHGPTRDYLRTAKNIICLEMEAAGLMDNFPCLVIRGISDYADTHKSDRWHGYASIVAAGYAKELLTFVPELTREPTAVELMPVSDRWTRDHHLVCVRV
ncbi:purine and uridine phosphorylase [Aspergillus indologenus CBS 114.80]|uniref:Purine and uridine phosphorylase n=1 Tax=Aspergillus indologenus CBS 114.80 TaxID=1450541 RepID=A0A2V5IPB1_9EURO|nr:purine and uridine phosphorylase [Aspergillus indologenus CBS 114.80]